MFLKKAFAVGSALALSVSLAACSGGSGDKSDAGESKSLSVGVPAGWDEGVVISNMMKSALEDQGYDLKLTDADIGAVFTSISKGDMDLLFDGWLPLTHKSYVEKYGDDMEDLGTWFDEAKLALAVNKDAPIKSIEELADHADDFNNEIVGIDAGAGITETTEKTAIPEYGLDNMNFKISSTAAMLAELDSAMKNKKNIVVTLWSPHWAYSAFDVRDLEDPKGAMGGAEKIHTFARKDFSKDNEAVAKMIKNFKLSAEELSDVENYVLNEHKDEPIDKTVKEWLDKNQEVRDRMKIEK
ncbi:glycine betaine ABC transporter substrate-binding protein [Gleimia hominis]|uniref:glycine betaine ABC transporter substrate-binding protein n=1 Tax=Gleimia hominis TaxID=595468 RepID=UPI000C80EA73|nr:glycine betaine ABC transporter substrate-binding protein [Gleimia hominis]WIK64311.1 glycine betaine ABC transporter substrate-binding protein [Gleimia hominis]